MANGQILLWWDLRTVEELGIFFQNGGIRNFLVVGLRNLSKMLLFANFGGIGNFYSKMVGLGFLW